MARHSAGLFSTQGPRPGDDAGQFSAAPYMGGGKLHGSDFIVDYIEFDFPAADLIGVPDGQPDNGN